MIEELDLALEEPSSLPLPKAWRQSPTGEPAPDGLRTMLGSISREAAEHARTQLEQCPVRRVERARLGDEAWRVADEFGWGRTYDAEYVALARLLDCRLMTLDARLRRGTDRLGFVIGPDEL